MANQDQTYRSLVMRKVQRLAQEHGGLAKIPRDVQQRLGFDVIAKRKGTSISVTIPEGDLSERISQLNGGLPVAKAFGKSKPEPDPFRKYTPRVSKENPTMEDFWIAQGWYKKDRIGVRLIRAKWQDDETVCADAVRFLIDAVLKKDPRDITKKDFTSNRLGGLHNDYYKSSPYLTMLEAGYAYSIQESLEHANSGNFLTDKFYPWEMKVTPNGVYDSKEKRIAAVEWLLHKLQKDPRNTIKEDFYSNRLGGLSHDHYNESPYLAMLEAGYAYSIQESLEHANSGNFLTDKFYPWEMYIAPQGFYQEKENRLATITWLLIKLPKSPKNITQEAFISNDLWGLLHYYHDSPHAAMLEAGLVTEADKFYMQRKGRARHMEI